MKRPGVQEGDENPPWKSSSDKDFKVECVDAEGNKAMKRSLKKSEDGIVFVSWWVQIH